MKLAEILARRRFLAGAGSGAAALSAVAVTAIPAAAQTPSADTQWKPERHPQDEWLDKIPGKHRFVFDTTTGDSLSGALRYATNYYSANQSGYGLKDSDLAVVVIARHLSTPYAFNDAIWTKYSEPLSNFANPGAAASKTNTYGRQLTGLTGRGAHLAVCQLATRVVASSIARTAGASVDDIYKEISENLLPNSHLMAAGIVAVNRAQEYGYAFVAGS